MTFKKIVKFSIGKLFSPLDKAILINSYGRSGSTVLTESIISSVVRKRSGIVYEALIRSIGQYMWSIELDKIRTGFVYKTHDYPPPFRNTRNKNAYFIYVFSDPVDVVLSLLRIYENSESDGWMRKHFNHLKSEYVKDFYAIVDNDTLNLERHFDSWLAEKRFPVAFVRYEALWENQKQVGEFLNIPLQLTPYRERKARIDTDLEILKRLQNTYSNLRSKLYNCDDFFTINT